MTETDIARSISVAELLAVVGERHAEGNVSALLNEDVLSTAQPISVVRLRAQGTLRAALGIVSALGVSVLVSRALPGQDVPDYLHPWVTAGCGVLAALPFLGWSRVLQLVESLTGR